MVPRGCFSSWIVVWELAREEKELTPKERRWQAYPENPAVNAGFSRSSRGAQQPRELPQPFFSGIGDRPVRHTVPRPMEDVEALLNAGDGLGPGTVRRVGGEIGRAHV